MRHIVVVAAAALLLAAACTPARAPWTAPGQSRDDADADWADCKRVAERQAAPRPAEAIGAGRQPYTNPLDDLDRRDAAKSAQRATDACMRAKGYFPAR